MTDDPRKVRLPLMVSQKEAAAIDDFRFAERLGSRAEAIRLLIEIGLDAASQPGRRFWDRRPEQPPEP